MVVLLLKILLFLLLIIVWQHIGIIQIMKKVLNLYVIIITYIILITIHYFGIIYIIM